MESKEDNQEEFDGFFKPDEERDQWGSILEYYLANIGHNIGMMCVFSFVTFYSSNGGPAFLIPFVIFFCLITIPLFFLQSSIGQFTSNGYISSYNVTPLLKGFGYATLFANIIWTIACSIFIALTGHYFIYSLVTDLSWAVTCNNMWNTAGCIEVYNASIKSNYSEDITPGWEYFYRELFRVNQDKFEMLWTVYAASFVVWLLVFLCNLNGVKLIGKVVFVTVIVPFVTFLGIFTYGIILPGTASGIINYLTPEFSKLADIRAWINGAATAFLCLGPGWGVVQNMASYNRFRNNTKRDAIVIPVVCMILNLLPGFFIHLFLQYLAHVSNSEGMVESKYIAGHFFAFVKFPEAISLLPSPKCWLGLYYMALFLLSINIPILQVDAMVSSLLDEMTNWKRYRILIVLGTCVLSFLCTLPFCTVVGLDLYSLLDKIQMAPTRITLCVVQYILLIYVYGHTNLCRDIEFMLGKKLEQIWFVMLKYVTPIVLVLMFIITYFYSISYHINFTHHIRAVAYLAWGIFAQPFICVPLYMVYRLVFARGSFGKRIRNSFKPANWVPLSHNDRLDYQRAMEPQESGQQLLDMSAR